jgi:hypothetical protein
MDVGQADDRVLMNLPSGNDDRTQQRTVVVLQNFFDELR